MFSVGASSPFVVYQYILCSTLKCRTVVKVTALTLIQILWTEHYLWPTKLIKVKSEWNTRQWTRRAGGIKIGKISSARTTCWVSHSQLHHLLSLRLLHLSHFVPSQNRKITRCRSSLSRRSNSILQKTTRLAMNILQNVTVRNCRRLLIT